MIATIAPGTPSANIHGAHGAGPPVRSSADAYAAAISSVADTSAASANVRVMNLVARTWRSPVERLEPVAVPLRDDRASDLHRRRELVRLDRELALEQR